MSFILLVGFESFNPNNASWTVGLSGNETQQEGHKRNENSQPYRSYHSVAAPVNGKHEVSSQVPAQHPALGGLAIFLWQRC